MPRNNELKKILLIGSGPIVIGQGCEFDYSGVQACKALREEGYEVVLVNSNPATIMTDPEFADRTYIEPITAEVIEAIIEREKPAHTMAHVCMVEPGLTIGFQAQIGIDSVLGGESPLARLDQSSLGGELRLGGDPAGRVGEQSQLGQTTRLGDTRP